jgi:hypothetical protein
LQQRGQFGFLPAAITVLALADGVLHLSLDFILFRGPPPGARPAGSAPPPRPPGAGPLVRMPLPLNELFIINFVGWVLLALLFWFGPSLLGVKRRVVDVLMMLWALGTILGWLDVGRPNPMNLGLLAKGIEVVLIVALILHATRQSAPAREYARAA